jgi:hypothetical protein
MMTATEAEWLGCTDPERMLRAMPAGATARKRRLLAVACCRLVFDWLVDNRSREALDVAEAFADGTAAFHELKQAHDRAFRAQLTVGGEPAQAAAHATFERMADATLLGILELVARSFGAPNGTEWIDARQLQTDIIRDVFGNPFHPVVFSASWRTDTVLSLARQMYEAHEFSAMPILADALQDAGCDSADILDHCRDPQQAHVRGCWVVDLVLGKE